MSAPRPRKIALNKSTKQLVVDWTDGFRRAYPLAFVRSRCPSATERVEREQANPLAVLKNLPSSEVTEIRPVGAYALGFTWSDGHNTGIYTWEYLLQLAQDPRVQTTPLPSDT